MTIVETAESGGKCRTRRVDRGSRGAIWQRQRSIMPRLMRPERFYTPNFYADLEATRDSARAIVPTIIDLLRPASMVDIGCGSGYWLAAATEIGMKDTLCVDGVWALKTQLAIPRQRFLEHDLRDPLKLGRRFDVALSLEVAEHLPESCAQTFVENLCELADRVVFSAAIPGQGGRNHLNEQWPGYWFDIFRRCGYECYDVLRIKIWSILHVMW